MLMIKGSFCCDLNEQEVYHFFYKQTYSLFIITISTGDDKFLVTITVPVGELMRGSHLSEFEFTTQQGKLTGMNESSTSCNPSQNTATNDTVLAERILAVASLNRSPSPTVADGKSFRYFFLSPYIDRFMKFCMVLTCLK